MPRFGPKDRCDIHPVYKPAVPGYKPPQPSEAEDGKHPGQRDGDHPPPSNDDDSNDGPDPDQGEGGGGNNGEEEQTGEGDGEGENDEGRHHKNATQMRRGAPPPANVQPEGPQRGSPWQVLRYDCAIGEDYKLMTPHLKRPVNWSMVGSQHPKGVSYREWDDELEEQNPWHQGGRPILKQ